MDSNMAHIPFVEHKKRMYKAYCQINKLKMLLILSNIIWLSVVVWLVTR